VGDRTLYKGPSDRKDPNTTLKNIQTTSEPKEELIQIDTSTDEISNELGEPPEINQRLNT